MINTTLEILPSPQENACDGYGCTLLSRRSLGYQLEISRETSGHLRGWITTDETREKVKLNGLSIYLNFKRATQLLKQSYLKFQKGAIEVLPRGLGGMKRKCVETCKEQVSTTSRNDIYSLVETISDTKKRGVVRAAVAILLKNNPAKKDLNLINNQIGDTEVQALAAALQVNQSLLSLNLQHNQIGAAGAQVLEAALQVNQSIQTLDLSFNQIGIAGTQALGTVLQVNHTLQVLNLDRNYIGDAGIQALEAALQVNQSLRSLNLQWNQIGIAGVHTMGVSLQINQTLQSLDLYGNQIGNAGAQAIGAALKVNQSLWSLSIGSNQIGDAGTQALGAALQVNQSLQRLHLGHNQIGDAGAQALETALQINHTLQSLNVERNQIDDDRAKEQIDTLLEANKQIATLFQQQITEVQNFLQSHHDEEGLILQDLPQLKALLQKWHTNFKNLIPSLEEILIQSKRTVLNDRYKQKLKGIITNLTNRLYDLWLESFESKVAALSNEYVMGKKLSAERNVELGYALYDTWLTFLGSDYPNWIEDHLKSLIPFGVLLDIAEGGQKKDVTDLTDAHSLFEQILSLRNESKDSLFNLNNQSPKP